LDGHFDLRVGSHFLALIFEKRIAIQIEVRRIDINLVANRTARLTIFFTHVTGHELGTRFGSVGQDDADAAIFQITLVVGNSQAVVQDAREHVHTLTVEVVLSKRERQQTKRVIAAIGLEPCALEEKQQSVDRE
jgi:hypothetical protein